MLKQFSSIDFSHGHVRKQREKELQGPSLKYMEILKRKQFLQSEKNKFLNEAS
jgi:hypothetical protein